MEVRDIGVSRLWGSHLADQKHIPPNKSLHRRKIDPRTRDDMIHSSHW
jgi:hypothetical protein